MPPKSVPQPDLLGRALLPLRAFLGVTFCFAGLQKLANPGFFDASDPASIQAQLAGSARTSPVHGLVSPLSHVAVAVGLVIALGELAIGVGTLLGLWARIAAGGGIVLSFMLFLTVSFHSAPYYTGADIVFVFAWTPLLLAGAGSVLSADAALAARARAREERDKASNTGEDKAEKPRPRQWAGRPITVKETSRREVVLKGTVTAVVAFASMVGAGLAAGLGRLGSRGTSSQAGGKNAAPSPAASLRPPATRTAVAEESGKAVTVTAVGPAKDVPVGQAAAFTDPATGAPSIVIQLSAGDFVAYDAVCPHAGCTVQYDVSEEMIVCPCHGSEFNPATGAVEVGPAVRGLTRIQIAPGPDGQLYVS